MTLHFYFRIKVVVQKTFNYLVKFQIFHYMMKYCNFSIDNFEIYATNNTRI